MKISIITACYNAEKTIADAMASVGRQRFETFEGCETFKKLEVEYIVVDGGSTDGTVEIIKNFAEQFHCSPSPLAFTFRWLSEKDNGMYDAINKGIKMATGDVIGILNADDVLDGDYVLSRVCEGWVRGEKVRGEKFDCLYGLFVHDCGCSFAA